MSRTFFQFFCVFFFVLSYRHVDKEVAPADISQSSRRGIRDPDVHGPIGYYN